MENGEGDVAVVAAADPATEVAPAPEGEDAAKDAPNAEAAPASYDNPEMGQTAEAAALNVSSQIDLQALPIRQYLENTMVALLVQGLTQLVRVRPEDPVEWLAAFLLKNNPNAKKQPAAKD